MTTSFSPDAKLTVPDGVSLREFGGEWIVLDLLGGNYFGLDEVGGQIFAGLMNGDSVAEIVRKLASAFEAAEPIIRDDVLRLIGELVTRGLVRIEEKEAS